MSKKIRLILFGIPVLWALLAAPVSARVPAMAQERDICEIQGDGPISPHKNKLVETSGVVTFDVDETWEKGFYIQDANCDGDPATSDALFVYTGEQADLVSVGDYVVLSGWVNEFYGMTEVSAAPEYIEIAGTKGLPGPVPFSPPWPLGAARAYSEAREGMRIAMSAAVVVGPTTTLDQTFVVDAALGVTRILTGMLTGPILRIGAGGLHTIEPGVRTGQHVLNLAGILSVENWDFSLRLTAKPVVVPSASGESSVLPDAFDGTASPIVPDLTFASLNLYNLFDTLDEPGKDDPVLTAGEYQTKLEKLARMISDVLGEPQFIAVQEAENAAVLQALSNRPEIGVQYGHVLIDGPDVRGIDAGLMYRLDRVTVLEAEQRQGCTALIDGLGPDGNLDVLNPANSLTCDLDGLPGLDGNRLFSRPPLVVRLEVCEADCSLGGTAAPFWVISVHLKSKTEDTKAVEYTLPRRLEQAAFLVDLVGQIEAADPGAQVILIGDFNDVPGSAPIELIASAGMIDLLFAVPPETAYTYIFEGVSQVLDHVFISQSLADDPLVMLYARPQPFAADYPADLASDPTSPLRATDHDPLLAGELRFNQSIFFPFFGSWK